MPEKKTRKSKIFVVSAPSGSGKTTLCNRLLRDELALANSVSMTTRPPRKGEKEGVDYRFVSKEDFESMIRRNEFLEYEENFGHFYGTPRKFVEDRLRAGRSVLLSIDVKGAMKVKKAYPDQSVMIFILPPSMTALKERLRSRKSDASEAILKRLELAEEEISHKDKYDHTIVNDKLSTAYDKLRDIIITALNPGD